MAVLAAGVCARVARSCPQIALLFFFLTIPTSRTKHCYKRVDRDEIDASTRFRISTNFTHILCTVKETRI